MGHMKLLDLPDKKICWQGLEIGTEAGAKQVRFTILLELYIYFEYCAVYAMYTSRAAQDTFMGHMRLLDLPDKKICWQGLEIGTEAGATLVRFYHIIGIIYLF